MRYSIFLSSLCCSVLLSACHQPGVIGRGYSSFKEPYKSAPGTKAAPIGYAYTHEQNTAVIESMRPAARDLIMQLEDNTASTVDRVYLTGGAQTAFYSALDHVLRDELTYRGYELATGPGPEVLPVHVSATQVKQPEGQGSSGMAPLFDVVLSGTDKVLAKGTYTLPSYAFTGSAAPALNVPEDASVSPAIDSSAPVPITGVEAEPLPDESEMSGAVSDVPAQTQTAP
ncbi:MAG: hypothetical protein KDI90_03970 [Alphaproteobacteria bacterium]|nr:hypothetical protein [Alphaproteobacteria bacterium]MCB9975911.1 hypothetical protein [Rhodospirillales bacterium]